MYLIINLLIERLFRIKNCISFISSAKSSAAYSNRQAGVHSWLVCVGASKKYTTSDTVHKDGINA